jgi:P-type Mg2+ transporter
MIAAEDSAAPSPGSPGLTPPTVPGSSPAVAAEGLTSAEAARRLSQFGPNQVVTGGRFRVLRTGLGLLANPLVLILLAASIVSGIVGETLDAGIIVTIVLVSVGLDFFQIFHSEQAASKLQSLVTLTASVWRDAQLTDIPMRDVVPGDVLELRAGDLVPADATLTTAVTLSVDQAALTGESLPVEKHVGAGPDGLLYAGTSIVSGIGQACVTATGARTQFGAIAQSLVQKAPATEYERGARSFGLIIMRTVVGLVLFVFLVSALLHHDPLESLLFALALAVGLTPEFLPMIMTVTLGAGAQRMAQGKVIVKRLAAIENLGTMDVLCSDKTGTLTRGVLTLQSAVDGLGRASEDVLRYACVNSALESGVRSPLDAAILAHQHAAIDAFQKRAELPFDFERRRVSVLVSGPDGVQVLTKGAPENVLAGCTAIDTPAGPVPFSDAYRQTAQDTFDQLSRTGYHVLGIAQKSVATEQQTVTPDDERDQVFCGFVAFEDPPDPSTADIVAAMRRSGVSIKILTGDGELITRTVCAQVGLKTDRVVLGDDLDRLSDNALAAIVEQTDVFARVNPAQKNRLIHALKRKRHVVGYLGDGINDAPSLHTADVGISVSNGVDVAKAAADIILLEKSLAAIHRGVLEGRRSFGNITKYILMGTSSNFGNMLSMAVAAALLPFLPLLPAQILLNNFLYDASQLTIPTDNVDASWVARPRKWDPAMIQRFMFGLGPVSSLYDFLTFGVMLWIFQAGPELFRAGWFIESLATQTLVIFVIRTAGNPFKSRPSRPLLLTVVGGVLAGLVVVMSPLGGLLGFAPLPPLFFGVLVLMTATYLALVQVIKRRFYAASDWRAA